jgi:tetraprenyl-beta-curcumene synthase
MCLVFGQARALLAAAARELLWGLAEVAHEIGTWERRALAIPDAATRQDALDALRRKRTHADGAALFSILPRRRDQRLLRLLVSYEVILDFLDNVHERLVSAANGAQLHLALADALNPDRTVSEYYREHMWREDGDYLLALVSCSRAGCIGLPSYRHVSERLIAEAKRAQVLGINHDPLPERRDERLRQWARQEYRDSLQASWFELTSAVSASLTIHALLALAAETPCGDGDIRAVYAAYFPWISATSTMLDSYVDQGEDLHAGRHLYIDHYAGDGGATGDGGAHCGVAELVARATGTTRGLPRCHRHAVIVACMIAMYLSKDSARAPHMRAGTTSLVRAGGPLARALVPVLRIWRVAYGQQSA